MRHSTRYIEPEDLANPHLEMIPVRNGCAGWCGCTGHCTEIAGFVTREHAERWQSAKALEETFKEIREGLLENDTQVDNYSKLKSDYEKHIE